MLFFSILFPWIDTFRSSMAHRVEIGFLFFLAYARSLVWIAREGARTSALSSIFFILYYTDDWVCVAKGHRISINHHCFLILPDCTSLCRRDSKLAITTTRATGPSSNCAQQRKSMFHSPLLFLYERSHSERCVCVCVNFPL